MVIRVVWTNEDERENILTFGIDFTLACQTVKNPSSLKIENLKNDYVFIGPTDSLSKILVVYCKLEEGFRKIEWARNASIKESNAYFNFLIEGNFQ